MCLPCKLLRAGGINLPKQRLPGYICWQQIIFCSRAFLCTLCIPLLASDGPGGKYEWCAQSCWALNNAPLCPSLLTWVCQQPHTNERAMATAEFKHPEKAIVKGWEGKSPSSLCLGRHGEKLHTPHKRQLFGYSCLCHFTLKRTLKGRRDLHSLNFNFFESLKFLCKYTEGRHQAELF